MVKGVEEMPTEKPTREQIEEARDRVRALLACFTQEPDIAQYVDGTEAMALQLLLDVTAPPPAEERPSIPVGWRVPPEFAEQFRDKAKASGVDPSQRLVALDRMAERLDLESELAIDLAQVQAESDLRQRGPRPRGGRPRKS